MSEASEFTKPAWGYLPEGSKTKGGHNPPNTSNKRPPPPQGSGGVAHRRRLESEVAQLRAITELLDAIINENTIKNQIAANEAVLGDNNGTDQK